MELARYELMLGVFSLLDSSVNSEWFYLQIVNCSFSCCILLFRTYCDLREGL